MLSPEERARIINDHNNGIQHQDYYVLTTKTGKIQVRRRSMQSTQTKILEVSKTAGALAPCATTVVPESAAAVVEAKVETKKEEFDLNSVTNRQLVEKMILILEQNSVSRDMNKNAIENERETEDNKRFIEEITPKVQAPEPKRRPRGRIL